MTPNLSLLRNNQLREFLRIDYLKSLWGLLSPTGIGGQKPSPLGEDFSTLAIWRIIEKAVIVSMI
ncbi:MAG: hypothetical protein ACYCVH_13355 [Ignavibacteriaceae bacterium]